MPLETVKGYCVSCQTDDLEVSKYPGRTLSEEPRELCDICAGTFIGNYTGRYGAPTLKDLAVAIAQVAHILRKEIQGAQAHKGGQP